MYSLRDRHTKERKERIMVTVNTYPRPEVAGKTNVFTTFPLVIKTQPDQELDELLANLTPDTPWGERQTAAKKLGYMRNPGALPGLLATLPTDPFWMVRCAIIQALEMIGDPAVIPTLSDVAEKDSFQVVRAYAAKAIERLA
jgi:HEAT repeat protein